MVVKGEAIFPESFIHEHLQGYFGNLTAFYPSDCPCCKIPWIRIGYFHGFVQFEKIGFLQVDFTPHCQGVKGRQAKGYGGDGLHICGYIITNGAIPPGHRLHQQTFFIVEDHGNPVYLLFYDIAQLLLHF